MNKIGLTMFLAVVLTGAVPHVAVAAKLPAGMNMDFLNYYMPAGNRTFVDYFKCVATWWVENADGTSGGPTGLPDSTYWAVKWDENGYPLKSPQAVPGFAKPQMFATAFPEYFIPGQYVILYDGTGTLTFFTAGFLTMVSTAPNRIVFNAAPGNGAAAVLRIASTDSSDHIRNIRILPIALEHSYNPAQPFSPEFLYMANCLTSARFRCWSQVDNGVTQPTWDRRAKRGTYSYGTFLGVPVEVDIQLCNKLKINPWFSIPHMVNDDYIRQWAELVRDSLDTSLTVYLEFSNELWNWAGGYPQSHWILDNCRDPDYPQWNAPDSIYNALLAIQNSNGDYPEKDAYMMQRTFEIWRSVFTGPDRHRLRCVAGIQLGYAATTGRILNYLFAQGTGNSKAGSLGHGCDLIAGAPYLPNGGLADMISGLKQDAAIAQPLGVGFCCYEGGTEANQSGGDTWQRSDDCYQQYSTMLDSAASPSVNCEVFEALALINPMDKYGHLDSLAQAALPEAQWPAKWRALMDHNNRVPVTVGVLSPATMNVLSARQAPFAYVNALYLGGVRQLSRLDSDVNGTIMFRLDGAMLGSSTGQSPSMDCRPATGIYVIKPSHMMH